MKKTIAVILLLMILPFASAGEICDVNAAVEVLKSYWRDELYGSGQGEGYLEIKNTRVIRIAGAPQADTEHAQQYAGEYFGDVECIVEFILYSDLMGAAPFYQNACAWDCVIVRKDGSMEVAAENPFEAYRARTYTNDFSGIVDGVTDLNQEYNGVFRLLEE